MTTTTAPMETFDGSAFISVDKLMQAVDDIGLNCTVPDPDRRRDELLERLMTTATPGSTVIFSDFVKCVKDIYKLGSFPDVSGCDFRSSTNMEVHVQEKQKDEKQIEIDDLKKENEILKCQLEAMESSYLKCEDDLIRLRKELQLQIENGRHLRQSNPSNTFNKNNKEQYQFDWKPCTSDHRDVAKEMLHFIEKIQRTLMKLEPPSRNRSLYRGSSCVTAPIKCTGTLRPMIGVARAATVNTTSGIARCSPPKYVRDQQKSRLDRPAILTKLNKEAERMVATVNAILEADENSSSYSPVSRHSQLKFVDSSRSQNVVDAIGKLHRNIPSTAVVTIMTRV